MHATQFGRQCCHVSLRFICVKTCVYIHFSAARYTSATQQLLMNLSFAWICLDSKDVPLRWQQSNGLLTWQRSKEWRNIYCNSKEIYLRKFKLKEIPRVYGVHRAEPNTNQTLGFRILIPPLQYIFLSVFLWILLISYDGTDFTFVGCFI